MGSVVTSGSSPAISVVVDGASRLTDGAKVSVVQPALDAPGRWQPSGGTRHAAGAAGDGGCKPEGAAGLGPPQGGSSGPGAGQGGARPQGRIGPPGGSSQGRVWPECQSRSGAAERRSR